MKYILSFLMLFSVFINPNKLKDCPKSPNCVCTQASKKSKRMDPIPMKNSLEETEKEIKSLMTELYDAQLVKDKNNILYFEVITKTGKFTDDVHFLIDEGNKLIHFRSASRKGYYDFGANRRRMKKIIAHLK